MPIRVRWDFPKTGTIASQAPHGFQSGSDEPEVESTESGREEEQTL